MIAQKYEYRPLEKSESTVPSVQLKQSEAGIIYRVDFYRECDYFRGDPRKKSWLRLDFSLPIDIPKAIKFFGNSLKIVPATLEECTEEQLKLLSSIKLNDKHKLPLEELQQIKSLEMELRSTIGDYRRR